MPPIRRIRAESTSRLLTQLVDGVAYLFQHARVGLAFQRGFEALPRAVSAEPAEGPRRMTPDECARVLLEGAGEGTHCAHVARIAERDGGVPRERHAMRTPQRRAADELLVRTAPQLEQLDEIETAPRRIRSELG